MKTVFNTIGKVIHTQTLQQSHNETYVNIGNWPAGIYRAVVFIENKVWGYCKFIIE
jgi:hypothetical protein